MRLINIETMKLESFINDIPAYAILSHMWERGEVTYQAMEGINAADDPVPREHRMGWQKIERTSDIARRDGWQYVWVDTCCIDKTNSAELGAAINSMFRWYEEAAVCYAYLADVSSDPGAEDEVDDGIEVLGDDPSDLVVEEWELRQARKPFGEFKHIRWFKRGWTLQELLAPKYVYFFDTDWTEIGSRTTLADDISETTLIPNRYLAGDGAFRQAPVATIFSWAAFRRTQRVEDRAYSLLGLFNMHMPLIYGEGAAAFRRLQEQIIQERDDEAIFARQYSLRGSRGILAGSPEDFYKCDQFSRHEVYKNRAGFALSNKGLVLRARLFQKKDEPSKYLLPLNCCIHAKTLSEGDVCLRVFLLLTETSPDLGLCRVESSILAVPPSFMNAAVRQTTIPKLPSIDQCTFVDEMQPLSGSQSDILILDQIRYGGPLERDIRLENPRNPVPSTKRKINKVSAITLRIPRSIGLVDAAVPFDKYADSRATKNVFSPLQLDPMLVARSTISSVDDAANMLKDDYTVYVGTNACVLALIRVDLLTGGHVYLLLSVRVYLRGLVEPARYGLWNVTAEWKQFRYLLHDADFGFSRTLRKYHPTRDTPSRVTMGGETGSIGHGFQVSVRPRPTAMSLDDVHDYVPVHFLADQAKLVVEICVENIPKPEEPKPFRSRFDVVKTRKWTPSRRPGEPGTVKEEGGRGEKEQDQKVGEGTDKNGEGEREEERDEQDKEKVKIIVTACD